MGTGAHLDGLEKRKYLALLEFKTKIKKKLMYLVIHIEIRTIKTQNTYLYGSHPAVLAAKQTTLILCNTTVYLKSSCASACMLPVSALSQAIIMHVSTNIL